MEELESGVGLGLVIGAGEDEETCAESFFCVSGCTELLLAFWDEMWPWIAETASDCGV